MKKRDGLQTAEQPQNQQPTPWKRNVLRAILTTATALLLIWIFSNSLQTGVESSSQSGKVMEIVQSVAAFIDPDSYIATATGEDYEFIHGIVRTIAHFSEFALLGALTGWCYFSYTKKAVYAYLPLAFLVCVPLVDEFLQSFTPNRAAEITDVLVDMAGAFTGLAFAVFTVWLGAVIYRKAQAKRQAKLQMCYQKTTT
jgi:VanZ family protein